MADKRTVDDILTEWSEPVSEDQPKLQPGYSWGESLKLSDIKVGDIFKTKGDRRMASTGGTVSKVSRVNIEYTTMYMGRIEMTLKIRKDELIDGYIARGKVMHEVVV